MSIDAEFLELMPHTVSIANLSSRNSYGVPTFGTATSYRARVVKKAEIVRDTAGAEVVSTTQVWLYGTSGVTPESRITLPDSSTPSILMVETYPDETGYHHDKVFCR